MKALIIINGKKQEKDIPIHWDQVTFGKFLKIPEGDDPVKSVAYFTGIPYETLLKAKILNLEGIIAALGFLNSPAQAYVPKTICGYPIPKDLSWEEVQMYVDLKNHITKMNGLPPLEQLSAYPKLCAVYACKTKFGEYDWEKAESMADEFLEAPCTEVMGIGNFTLLKLAGLKHSTRIGYQIPSTRLNKFRLALKGLFLRMGYRLQLMIWSPKLDAQKKKY